MHALSLRLDGTSQVARAALGAVVCAPVRAPGGKRLFNKGHIITESDLEALSGVDGLELHLLVPEDGDVHEDEAAMRLGRALAGPGVRVAGPREARARLEAGCSGLLRVDPAALLDLNSIQGVAVYTLFDGQPVREGSIVAEAKVTPLLVSGVTIERAEAVAPGAALSVRAFRQARAAALIRERIGPAQARRIVDGLSRKLAWFGSSLGEVRYVALDTSIQEVTAHMRGLLDTGIDLLLTSGSSVADPFDPLLNALQGVPASLDRVGVPAHPGSMLWLAHAGSVPILGVPSCGSFSEATAFDLVLPLILAGAPLTPDLAASLGQGGLLKPNDHRFPRYQDPEPQP